MSFVKKEKVTLLLLLITFLNPFYYGYRIAILFIFIVFFNSRKYIFLFDKNVFLLFLFAGSYEIFAALRPDAIDKTLISIIPNIFIPSLMYLVGKKISAKYPKADTRTFFLFFISASFAFIPLISILTQILNNGFEFGQRSMYLIWDKKTEFAATGLGSYFSLSLASIGLLNVGSKSGFQKKLNYAIIALFVLSIICVIRLGSRTQLVIVLASFLISYILTFSRKHIFKNIFFIGTAVFLSVYLFDTLSKLPEISILFERGDSGENGIATAGGRTGRWIGSFNSIFTDPWGWKFSRYGYAHNLWLDVARVSGVIPLFFLLLFTFSSFKLYVKSFKIVKYSTYLKLYITLLILSIFLGFNVEPVMDGLYLLFLIFCLFIGFLAGIVKKGTHC